MKGKGIYFHGQLYQVYNIFHSSTMVESLITLNFIEDKGIPGNSSLITLRPHLCSVRDT